MRARIFVYNLLRGWNIGCLLMILNQYWFSIWIACDFDRCITLLFWRTVTIIFNSNGVGTSIYCFFLLFINSNNIIIIVSVNMCLFSWTGALTRPFASFCRFMKRIICYRVDHINSYLFWIRSWFFQGSDLFELTLIVINGFHLISFWFIYCCSIMLNYCLLSFEHTFLFS